MKYQYKKQEQPIHQPTRLERKIQKLSDDIKLGEGILPYIHDSANENENAFLYRLQGRWKGAKHFRAGWPDFLVERADGAIVGVEVKSQTDRLRPAQVQMFAMLEKVGLPIFVWTDYMPETLIPWRKFHEKRTELARKKRKDEALERLVRPYR